MHLQKTVHLMSPIGMYPRRVSQDTIPGDTQLKAEDQIALCIGVANRDERRFQTADCFNINRPRAQHPGFRAEPHFYAGTRVTRALASIIAVPMFHSRLENLRLNPE